MDFPQLIKSHSNQEHYKLTIKVSAHPLFVHHINTPKKDDCFST